MRLAEVEPHAVSVTVETKEARITGAQASSARRRKMTVVNQLPLAEQCARSMLLNMDQKRQNPDGILCILELHELPYSYPEIYRRIEHGLPEECPGCEVAAAQGSSGIGAA